MGDGADEHHRVLIVDDEKEVAFETTETGSRVVIRVPDLRDRMSATPGED